ncbi:MAG TPA: 6-carboxytetrahydropterin synthase [Gemmatimonadales bacterium]|jgi:6-pyruvoyltetrahydropterin/6-carboxytetrahydropterin synthase|nr:6-carboxytetrahydropterin synthase [Gemmatimonadales bacterium]
MSAHYLLSAEAGFSAAHTLPGVPMCERMHGHNWRTRVTVRVEQDALDRSGMGVDFRTLERIAGEAVGDFEHRYLNELEPFREGPPTAERLARVVCGRVEELLARAAPAAQVVELELWEMPQYRVVYRPR